MKIRREVVRIFRAVASRRFVKDFSGPIISLLALFATGLTIYLSMFRVVDDVRFTLADDLPFPYPSSVNEFAVRPPATMTFINSGNRAAAILKIRMGVYQAPPDEGPRDCLYEKATKLAFETDAFVLKPGEIVVKQTAFANGVKKNEQGEAIFALEHPGRPRAAACLVFDVVTPDNVANTIVVPMITSHAYSPEGADAPYGFADITGPFTRPVPIRLLK